MLKFITWFDGWLWGLPLIIILLGTHIFCTIRSKFIQRKVGRGIKLSVTPDPDGEGEVSQFGALATALAATIGTGNIIGVATAFASGGPGAIFWCWITGVLGMATKYMETVMSVKYREQTEDGRMIGGAMYALERGLHAKWLGVTFALLGAVAAFGIGCMTQANSIATALNQNFGVSPLIAGVAVAAITGVVIIGGVKSITKVTERLVPFMAAFYVIGCIWVLIRNGGAVGTGLVLIVKSAFSMQAGAGGLFGFSVGAALRYGCARGLFSNESGMGSAPIVAASAKTRNSVRQSLVSMTGTFWDTIVVCTITGLAIASSGVLGMTDSAGEYLTGSDITIAAFKTVLGTSGGWLVTIGITLFAFSTILGWEYHGEKAFEYLLGTHKYNMFYRVLFSLVVYLGCTQTLNLVWSFSDIANALMAITNLICMLILSKEVAQDIKAFQPEIDNRHTEKRSEQNTYVQDVK